MEWIGHLLSIVLHLDRYLPIFIQAYGNWIYGVLFVILFCETGLVVAPFLPGDSLLFVAGAVAASGGMNPIALFVVLALAAIVGDSANYWLGGLLGPRIFRGRDGRFIRREHLERTRRFYARHGGKTVVIARFIPIIRTFAPFVAGIGHMTYGRFLAYNVLGGIAWVGAFVGGGYFFGGLPIVKENLTAVILGIIVVSLLPGMVGYLRHRSQANV
ncbi:MAG: DedA family protein [Betaproteobacteria bacterium]|nr:DedA family protein [Betaproteobacteria bacterium]